MTIARCFSSIGGYSHSSGCCRNINLLRWSNRCQPRVMLSTTTVIPRSLVRKPLPAAATTTTTKLSLSPNQWQQQQQRCFSRGLQPSSWSQRIQQQWLVRQPIVPQHPQQHQHSPLLLSPLPPPPQHQQQQQHQYFSSTKNDHSNNNKSSQFAPPSDSDTSATTIPYHSYEYPWATEPPTITRTTARDAAAAAAASSVGELGKVETMDDATTANSSSPVNSSSSNHENGTRDNRNEPLVPSTSTSSWFGGFFSSPLNDKNPAATATSATVVSTSPSSHSTFTDRNTSTTTVASDNGSSYSSSSSSSRGQSKKGLLSTLASAIAPSTAGEDDDPFDDEGNLSADEIESRRQTQKEQLSTRTGCLQPITHRVPSYIPPNIPATELATPETIVTVLNNGIRVVSQETYGQVSTVGMVSDFGSRYETVSNHTTGITHLLELTAFGACSGGGGCSGRSGYRSSSEVAHQLQEWGGTRFVSTGREQSIHCIDLLRPNVGQAVGMLSDVLLRPQFLESELDEARMAIQFQSLPEHTPPELLLTEALQKAAYGSHQQLGQPHFCTEEYSPHLTRTAAVQYWHDQFLANPHGMVVGGAGVNHDEFVTLVDRHFGHLLPQPLLNEASDANQSSRRVRSIPSQYQGGECLVPLPALMTEEEGNNEDGSSSSSNAAPVSVVTAEQRLTRVALALEVPGGWHSDDLVVACVLQTLLGGGSSFSAGGPGKGMYSRLYRQVLNQYRWAESAEAFTAFHSESGLFGISGSTPADKAPDMIHVFCRHLALLALEPVSQPELDRARNMLKNNVLTQLESRLILFEDMSRQVLTYGKREDIRETCEKINAVTAADIKAAVQRALSKPPTLAAVGVDLGSVPNFEQVELWLQQ